MLRFVVFSILADDISFFLHSFAEQVDRERKMFAFLPDRNVEWSSLQGYTFIMVIIFNCHYLSVLMKNDEDEVHLTLEKNEEK